MLRVSHLALLASLVLSVAIAPARVTAEPLDAPGPQVYECAPGPWGNVEWHYIYLEAPEGIVDQYAQPSPNPSWTFSGATPGEVRTLLSTAGIAAATVDAWLADKRAILEGPESVTLFPSVAEIESLSRPTRQIVYAELAKSPHNEFHVDPFFIFDRSIDEWLGPRKVRPEIRKLFERLTYQRGDVLAFSDMSVLMSYAKDAAEARDLMKLCTRIRAIMAYERVDATSDLDALAKYWTVAPRRKDVRPILESVGQLAGGGRLGLAHLLPSLPRKLMYTYPTSDLATSGKLPNCHWTTLNFFNHRVENLLLDTRLATSRVLQAYQKVEPPYTFGDALFFLDGTGGAVHSFTYICDDLVFTKNGDAMNAPWCISRIGTMRRLYAATSGMTLQGYRRQWETGL